MRCLYVCLQAHGLQHHLQTLQRENGLLQSQVLELRQNVQLLGGNLQGRLSLAQVRRFEAAVGTAPAPSQQLHTGHNLTRPAPAPRQAWRFLNVVLEMLRHVHAEFYMHALHEATRASNGVSTVLCLPLRQTEGAHHAHLAQLLLHVNCCCCM